ncbi:unnamed protein product [Effrenium voratum]|uniref:Uncharacterized protein n=1 Tax=Effrenium voratum TaxID=2562239 RepID=A0AA36NGT0_9DINO|nr:unnamed protein product [Effrenium voratum]CAJ1402831.1 unnamed protein product [Effrenium voratum]CAJ1424443.1 unnamed protein product [Effrenium voratum]
MDGLAMAMEDAHICPRREHNPLAPSRPEVLHCYGVDFLANKEVLEIFAEWKPQQVEWLDDSSCNVILESEAYAQKAIQELAAEANEPWTRTRPLSAGSKDAKKGKAKRGGLKEFCLQLRIATEADRKDPGHSGHTDSIYYAHVKEQQAQQKQELELRRMKKRQRQMTPRRHQDQDPGKSVQTAQSSGDVPTDVALPQAGNEIAAKEAPGLQQEKSSGPAPSILSARLTSCGLLDPLLFMRASSKTQGGPAEKEKPEKAACSSEPSDLKAMMKRAEAEYAAVLPGAKGAAKGDRGRPQRPGREAGKGRGRGRDSTPGRPGGQQRGKKRRPVEQEPRPVSEAAPPQRKAELFPEIESFLRKNGVRYRRYVLQRSFRSIKYAQQEAAKTRAMAQKQGKPDEAKAKAQSNSPWEEYMKANASFISHGIFMQTVAWKVDGRRVLSVVPHSQMTDTEKLAKAVQKPLSAVQQCKLKDISQETGFPVFVCPPFGYPPDADGRPPLLLVDSSVTELKRPLLFDCGCTGLCLTVSEFLRSTRAVCVEGLAQPMPNQSQAMPEKLILPCSGVASPATPEPAPEPAPVAGEGDAMVA